MGHDLQFEKDTHWVILDTNFQRRWHLQADLFIHCAKGCPKHRGYKYAEDTVSALEELTASFSQMEHTNVANSQINNQSTASTQKYPCVPFQSLTTTMTSNSLN